MRNIATFAMLLPLVSGCMSSGEGTGGGEDGGGDNPGDSEAVTAAVEIGALAYENWTLTAAGGTGALPAGETEAAYVTCVSCHGWDLLGKDGGFVRKARTAAEPNAGRRLEPSI